MKTIIAGSRKILDKSLVYDILDNLAFNVSEVVCGMAEGVDLLGKNWAEDRHINVVEFPALWKKEGYAVAGFKRNQRMADYGEALVLIWDGVSTGSLDMLKRARAKKMLIDIYDLSQPRLF